MTPTHDSINTADHKAPIKRIASEYLKAPSNIMDWATLGEKRLVKLIYPATITLAKKIHLRPIIN